MPVNHSDSNTFRTGNFHDYLWLTDTTRHFDAVVRLGPQILLNRYVAITSTDSGPLALSDEQTRTGWFVDGGVAYSPKITVASEIPHQLDGPDRPGFDECYVFEKPTKLGYLIRENFFLEESKPSPGRIAVFVNLGGFALHDIDGGAYLASLFWPQMQRISPIAYIADGQECLTFITSEQNVFQSFCDALQKDTMPR